MAKKKITAKKLDGSKGRLSLDKGFVFSIALHGGILSAAVIGLPEFSRELEPPQEPITVEITHIEKERTVKAPEKQQEAKVEPKKQEINVAREEQAATLQPDAMPTLKKQELIKEVPAPRKKPELTEQEQLRARVRPRVKPKAPKRFNISQMSEFIDRSLKEEQKEAQQTKEAEEKKEKELKIDLDKLQQAASKSDVNSATIYDSMAQKLANCWTRPPGMLSLESMLVPIRITLSSEGVVVKKELLDKAYESSKEDLSGLDADQRFKKVLGDSVLRAIDRCKSFEEAVPLIKRGERVYEINFRPMS